MVIIIKQKKTHCVPGSIIVLVCDVVEISAESFESKSNNKTP